MQSNSQPLGGKVEPCQTTAPCKKKTNCAITSKATGEFSDPAQVCTANILGRDYVHSRNLPPSVLVIYNVLNFWLTTSTYSAEAQLRTKPPPPLSSTDPIPSLPTSPEKPQNEALVIAPYLLQFRFQWIVSRSLIIETAHDWSLELVFLSN